MKKIFLFLLSLISTATIVAQEINGSWTGKLNAGSTELNIVFNIEKGDDGSFTCTLDSPDQGAKGIPAEISVTDGTKVKISIQAIMVVYEGELKDGEIKGTFTQNGFSFPLNMKPGTVERRRHQTPQPPYPYKTEEVSFTNADDNATLSGTLTYPVGYENMDKTNVPVVIMVTGSGLQNRDEEVFFHKPFLVIADFLARNGIASLRYDDRGIGKSTGNAATATTENNMKDALAAITFARNSGKFGKTGILGHSEGGTIAFMLGGKGKTDFIVTMAGTAVKGDRILIEQNRATLALSGMPAKVIDDYCNVMKGVLDAIITEKGTSNPDSTTKAIAKAENSQLPVPAIENLAKVISTCTPWLKYFIAYDPANDIQNTNCPVMAINGSNDTQVMANTNLSAIRGLLPQNSLNNIKEYAGLNHLFQHSKTGLTTEYVQIEETISPEVLQDVAEWINKVK